jgi:hypothetical protein
MSKPSSASLSVLPVAPIARVVAPDGLSDAEARLWTEVVDSKPADWFGGDTAPLLLEYVRAVCHSDDLHMVIRSMTSDDESWASNAKPYMDFLRLRDMESKRAVSIATKLRLTPQSRYTPKAAATANGKVGNGGRLWDRPAAK